MTEMHTLLSELESTWRLEIPLTSAMGIQVVGYGEGTLRVRAPLEENRNVHGTAFAGSLFSVCVLTGWGAAWLALRLAGLEGQIVVADSRIGYRRAVTGEIACACRPDPDGLERSLADLRASGRMRLPLVCTIDSNGKAAVLFEADYVVRRK